jgi:amino acid adenylation domain-containing protein
MALFKKAIIQPFLDALTLHCQRQAFCINEQVFTYKDLNLRIGAIYNSIKNENDEVIGVITNDEIDTYAAIWAIWFARKSYVPLNPSSPEDLNNRIKAQLGLHNIIDSKVTSTECQDNAIDFDDVLKNVEFSDTAIVYTLFTSGSTGVPKGVPISADNLAHFMESFWAIGYNLTPQDKGLQMFELTFDLSVMSFLAPLLRGGSVYTIPKDRIKFAYIFELLTEHNLTIALMVPSTLNFLKPYFDEIDCPMLRYSLFCGEALHVDIVDAWSKCVPNARIDNVYGPTENTIFCTYYTYKRNALNTAHNGILSIGQPMMNTFAKVFNEEGQLANELELGELCLAGTQLTPGYLNNQELNKQAFFEFDDLEENKTIRYYHSGDLCIRQENGDINYAGRKDTQIKIQGFRVELSEIEFQAKSFFGQPINIVGVVTENKQGNSEIILVIEGNVCDTTNLRKFLEERLTWYMLPKEIQFLNQFPLNTNGKIDRKAIKNEILIPKYTLRQATMADLNFLIEVIIAAEKGNSAVMGMAQLTGTPETEISSVIKRLFEEEIEGCEFFAEGFTIAELAGEPVAALSTWIEGSNPFDQPSAVLKSNLFAFVLGSDKMAKLIQHKTLLEKLRLIRTKGSHQVEYIYVKEGHRGKNLVEKMIAHSLDVHRAQGYYPTESELEVFSNNNRAIQSYNKLGYTMRRKAHCEPEDALNILPFYEKIQLYKKI